MMYTARIESAAYRGEASAKSEADAWTALADAIERETPLPPIEVAELMRKRATVGPADPTAAMLADVLGAFADQARAMADTPPDDGTSAESEAAESALFAVLAMYGYDPREDSELADRCHKATPAEVLAYTVEAAVWRCRPIR